MADYPLGQENVISVAFLDDSNAYEALARLKELASQHQIELAGAAVVARGEDGQISEKNEAVEGSYTGMATGGLLGLIIGIVGGPLGILIGGATGLAIGSLFDIDDTDETESVLGEISKSVRAGRAALLAEVNEQSSEVIDTAMVQLGGTVLRRSVDEVEAEIAVTEKAQRDAKKEARKELHDARHKKHEDEIHANVEELKAKFHRHKNAASTGS
jgi:uncharacterized membrane protein